MVTMVTVNEIKSAGYPFVGFYGYYSELQMCNKYVFFCVNNTGRLQEPTRKRGGKE